MAIDEGETDFKWIDIYLKPISGTYGEVGFGYKYNEQNSLIITEDLSSSSYTVYDKPNNTNTAAKKLSSFQGVRAKGEFKQYYLTYNIPSKDKWYDGFGIQYGYETSDFPVAHTEKKGMILHPDTTSHLYMIGFNKQLSEIDTGFSFKTLQIGAVSSTYDYYDYDTAANSSFSSDGSFYDIEMIFMFKPSKKRQIYLSFGRMERWQDSYDRDEFVYELGVVF